MNILQSISTIKNFMGNASRTVCNDTLYMALEEAVRDLEKFIPQKPINPDDDYGTFECPNCGGTIYASDALKDHKYCLLCGQAIDWYTGNQEGE